MLKRRTAGYRMYIKYNTISKIYSFNKKGKPMRIDRDLECLAMYNIIGC